MNDDDDLKIINPPLPDLFWTIFVTHHVIPIFAQKSLLLFFPAKVGLSKLNINENARHESRDKDT